LIDASTFSTSYTAIWNEIAPTCELFVRQLNQRFLKRAFPPMPKTNTPNRTLIAEYGFSLFTERGNNWLKGVPRPLSEIQANAKAETNRRLKPLSAQGVELEYNFDEAASFEVQEISDRLSKFFLGDGASHLVLRPIFPGCGFIDASEGDVIHERTIFEVKTVDRFFRSNDVRQLVTYAALNSIAKKFDITDIGLMNPRNGQYCVCSMEEVAIEVAGLSKEELCSSIIHAISSGGTSR
jgi:hypothetical protein